MEIICITLVTFPSKKIQGREKIDLSPNGLVTLYLDHCTSVFIMKTNCRLFYLNKPFLFRQRAMYVKRIQGTQKDSRQSEELDLSPMLW